MKNKLVVTLLLSLLLTSTFITTLKITPTTAMPDSDIIDVSQPKQLTTDEHHDRNPSFFIAQDGTWWIFFARGRLSPAPPDPDDDRVSNGGGYDIAYLKSIDEGASWTEGSLPQIPDLGTAHGAIWPAALQDDNGNFWVFYTILGPTADVYYFKSVDGGVNWIGPIATGIKNLKPVTNHHMDAAWWNGKFWVFLALDKVYAFDSADGVSWNGPYLVSDPSLAWVATPRIMLDGDVIRLVYFGPSGVYISSSNDGVLWINIFVTASGVTDFDPALVKVGNTYHLFWAPAYEIPTPVHWHQWIMRTTSTDFSTWSTPKNVTAGQYGEVKWWDYWAEPANTSLGLVLFYSSLKDGTTWGDSNIFMLPVDWDPNRNHYEAIQPAIDKASPGDTIIVHEGTYNEALYISKSLTIKGASIPVIKGGGTFTTNYMGASWTREAVIFVVNSTDVILESLDIEGEGLGPGYNDGVVYVYSSGEIRNCIVSPNTIGDMYSLGVEARASDLKIMKVTIENFGRIGAYFANCTGGVYQSTIIGQVYSDANQVNYGIEIEPHQGVRGVIEIIGNDIYNSDNTYLPEPTWSSAGILIDGWKEYMDVPSSTVIIQCNNIHDNYHGIEAAANALSYAHYNNIYNNTKYGVISAPDYLGNNETFDARYNWWGDPSGPSGVGPGIGDAVSENVNFSPWLYTKKIPPLVHNIAVTQLTATPLMAEIGEKVYINVTVKNLGNTYETFTLIVNYGPYAQVETIIDLQPGGEVTFNYEWDTTGEAPCFHAISALAGPVPEETNIRDNYREIFVRLVSYIPEPTIVAVEPNYKKGFKDGYLEVNVTISELDAYWDLSAFDIELYYNTTMMDVVSITLGEFAIRFNLTFQIIKEINEAEGYIRLAYTWDFISIPPQMRPTPYGQGTLFTVRFALKEIGVCVLELGSVNLVAFGNATKWCTPLPESINVNVQDGSVEIVPRHFADLNADGKINIQDVVIICAAYDSTPSDPNWNPWADLAPPYGIINIYDVVTLCVYYDLVYDP